VSRLPLCQPLGWIERDVDFWEELDVAVSVTGNPGNTSLRPYGHVVRLEEWTSQEARVTLDAAREEKNIYLFILNLFNGYLSNSDSVASNDCLMVKYTGQAIVAVTI
jgi:hypothetical protein